MPELPEVETMRRALEAVLAAGSRQIVALRHGRVGLRRPFPRALSARVRGRTITGLARHGKYLLWNLDGLRLVNHLGMTGTWRVAAAAKPGRPHDHVVIALDDGRHLIYHDPRRFGVLDLHPALGVHPLLAGLGPDAMDPVTCSVAHVVACCRGRRTAIKVLLLDQRVIAGIGNIYANEACFRAGIDPRRAAGRIAPPRLERLLMAIRAVLTAAITAGGTTISDYRNALGDQGWFQHDLQVYGRAGQTCRACGRLLDQAAIGGRVTVWCRRCQR